MVPAWSRHCGHRLRRRRRRHHTAAAPSTSGSVGAEAPRLGRRTAVPYVLGVMALLCCCSPLLPAAEAMTKNDETDSNSLGLLAQACATSFCGAEMNGLDLWLSLEQRCDVESTPSLVALWANGGGGGGGGGGGSGRLGGAVADAGGAGWSATSTALVCACVWSVLAYAGFRSGVRVGTQTKGGYPVA